LDQVAAPRRSRRRHPQRLEFNFRRCPERAVPPVLAYLASRINKAPRRSRRCLSSVHHRTKTQASSPRSPPRPVYLVQQALGNFNVRHWRVCQHLAQQRRRTAILPAHLRSLVRTPSAHGSSLSQPQAWLRVNSQRTLSLAASWPRLRHNKRSPSLVNLNPSNSRTHSLERLLPLLPSVSPQHPDRSPSLVNRSSSSSSSQAFSVSRLAPSVRVPVGHSA